MFWENMGLPTIWGKRSASFAAFLVLAACTTNIQPKDETQTPPSAPFGQFAPVLLKPIANQTPDAFPQEAVGLVQTDLQTCLPPILGAVIPYSDDALKANPTALVLEPVILDGKKVSATARVFLGALAGSSAVQMQVTYRSAKDGAVLAQPVFYAKAAAMSGTWTLGIQDYAMLDRLADNTCRYTATYKTTTN